MKTSERYSHHGRTVLLMAALALLTAWPSFGAATIQGKTLDPDGKALGGSTLTLSDTAGTVVATVTSDKKGQFKLDVPAAGSYQLVVEHDGFGPWRGPVDVADGAKLSTEIKLLDEAQWRQQRGIEAFNSGVQALQSGDVAAGLASIENAAELVPEIPEVQLVLATVYRNEQRWEEGAAALERFLALRPDVSQLADVAFDLYRHAGQQQEAQAALALVTDPAQRIELAKGVYNDGVLSAGEDDDAALAYFEQAVAIDPSLSQAYQGMAAIEFNREAYAESLPHLERLLELQPDSLSGLRMRYYSMSQTGDAGVGAALAAYLDQAPDDTATQLLADATALFENGAADEAADILVPLVEARPQMAVAHYQLGLVLASSDKAEAKRHLEHFLDLAPDHDEAAAARAMIAEL